MYQGTTPTYILEIDGYDLTDKRVFVTLQAKLKKITKKDDDLTVVYENDTTSIAFRLSQEETLGFDVGSALVQVRFIDENGIALATKKAPLVVNDVLLHKVITYDRGDTDGN